MSHFFNRHANYEQPGHGELRPGHIVKYRHKKISSFDADKFTFLCVVEATPECLRAYDIAQHDWSDINEYDYKMVLGINPKDWIIDETTKLVLDALLIGNGFRKTQLMAWNYAYIKTVDGVGMMIDNGDWSITYGDHKSQISFLHEIQDAYKELTGQELDTGMKVY